MKGGHTLQPCSTQKLLVDGLGVRIGSERGIRTYQDDGRKGTRNAFMITDDKKLSCRWRRHKLATLNDQTLNPQLSQYNASGPAREFFRRWPEHLFTAHYYWSGPLSTIFSISRLCFIVGFPNVIYALPEFCSVVSNEICALQRFCAFM